MTVLGRSATPRVLDLFCGVGGAGEGYRRAGFEVVGVDIAPQPRYPFEFHQADALEFPLEGFDAVHASPPCPRYSSITAVSGRRDDHPDLIAPIRQRLDDSGLLYVIENVPRAPLHGPVVLCGVALGLTIVEDDVRYVLRRHRLFECNFPLLVPPCACRRGDGVTLGVYGGGTRQHTRRGNYNGGATSKANLAQARALMGIGWGTRQELTQAIPPAYTELLGEALLVALRHKTVTL